MPENCQDRLAETTLLLDCTRAFTRAAANGLGSSRLEHSEEQTVQADVHEDHFPFTVSV